MRHIVATAALTAALLASAASPASANEGELRVCVEQRGAYLAFVVVSQNGVGAIMTEDIWPVGQSRCATARIGASGRNQWVHVAASSHTGFFTTVRACYLTFEVPRQGLRQVTVQLRGTSFHPSCANW